MLSSFPDNIERSHKFTNNEHKDEARERNLFSFIDENKKEKKDIKKRSLKNDKDKSPKPLLIQYLVSFLKWIASNFSFVIVQGAGLWVYNKVNNPLYYSEIYLIITIIISLFFALLLTWVNKSLSIPIPEIIKFIIYIGTVFIMISYVIAPYLFPPFEIMDPKEGDSVERFDIVEGHGAIPSSKVSVYVIDDLGHTWLQNTVNTTTDGKWKSERVIFGEDRRSDVGRNFTIYATLNKDNTIYETPHVTVKRS